MSIVPLLLTTGVLTPGAGGGLLSRVQALFDGGTYPGFLFKASRFGEGFFYQESTFQTLVTATTQSIGGAYDASRMGANEPSAFIAAQPELAANPGGPYTETTGWVASGAGSLSIDGDYLKLTSSGGVATVSYTFTDLTVSAAYLVHCEVESETQTSGSPTLNMFGSAAAFNNSVSRTELIVADATSKAIAVSLGGLAANGEYARIASISVKRIPGYHATQATSNSRPTLRQPSGYAMRFDGVDDYLATTLNPQSSGALICAGTLDAVGDLVMGSADATPNRCFLGLNASGYLGAGIGSDSYSTIAGSTDITGVDGFNALRWNGTTVQLNRDDTSTPIYSAGQNGTPVNSRPIYLGAYNNAGTAGLFADADIDFFFAIMGRELSNADLALIKAYRDQ